MGGGSYGHDHSVADQLHHVLPEGIEANHQTPPIPLK